ncbi:MAG: TetR/AcrR family transcriptional regulator [Polyangia bacterium]
MTVRARQDRRADRTRTKLLDAAQALFLERGYDATLLGDVTERADLGTGTLYLHFRDKRGLYEAVVRRAVLSMWNTWVERSRGVDELAEQIRLMIRVAIEFFTEDRRRAVLFLEQGPALETFLIEDISAGMGRVLRGRVAVPSMAANLVIGAALAAGRWWLSAPRAVDTEELIRTTVNFCGGGIAALQMSNDGARARRRNRAKAH